MVSRRVLVAVLVLAAVLAVSSVEASVSSRLSKALQPEKSLVAVDSEAAVAVATEAEGPILDGVKAWWAQKTAAARDFITLDAYAKVSAVLNEFSYTIKANQKKEAGVTDMKYTARELPKVQKKYSRTELNSLLGGLRVEFATWDQQIYSRAMGAANKRELWIGGHGSVTNANDWLGQNLGLVDLPPSFKDWLGYGNTQNRDQRLAAMTQNVIGALKKQGVDVVAVVGWGHSMSAFKNARAIDMLLKRPENKNIEFSGYFYNPGGNNLLPIWNSHIKYYIEKGELLQTLGILLPSNIPMAVSTSVTSIVTPGCAKGGLLDLWGALKNHGIANQINALDAYYGATLVKV